MASVSRFNIAANQYTLDQFDEISILESDQATYTTPGTDTWTCPSDINTVCVAVCGGGGGGGDGSGGGGGGGGFAYGNNIPVTPGATYNLQVGDGGGVNTDGTASWFNTSSYLYANGGSAGTASTSVPSAVGQAMAYFDPFAIYGSYGVVSGLGMSYNSSANTYSWTAPDGVTSVSVVCIGGGGIGGAYGSGGGAGGGALTYCNNISVTPGTTYNLYPGRNGYYGGVHGETSWFISNTYLYAGGGANGLYTSSGYSSNSIHGGDGGAAGYAANGGGGGSCIGIHGGYGAGGSGGTGGGTASGKVAHTGGSGGSGGYGASGVCPNGSAGAFYGGGSGGGGGASSDDGYLPVSYSGGGGVGPWGQTAVDAGGYTTVAGPSTSGCSKILTAPNNGGSGGADGGEGQGSSSWGGNFGGGGGGQGVVRIIWGSVSGVARTFPSTHAEDQTIVLATPGAFGGGGGGGGAGYQSSGGNGGTARSGATYPGGAGGTAGGTAAVTYGNSYTGGHGGAAYNSYSAFSAATIGNYEHGGAAAGGAGGVKPLGGGGIDLYGKSFVNNIGESTTPGAATPLTGSGTTGTAVATYNGASGGSDGNSVGQPQGQILFTSGTLDSANNRYHSIWTVPAGVTSICIACVGGGGDGGKSSGDSGGGGGGFAWANNISVTPGQQYYITVGGGGSFPGGYNGGTSSVSLGTSYSSPIIYATGGHNGYHASINGGYGGGGGGAGGYYAAGGSGGDAATVGTYGNSGGGAGGTGGGTASGIVAHSGGSGGNAGLYGYTYNGYGVYAYGPVPGDGGTISGGGGGAGYHGGNGGGIGLAPTVLTLGTAGVGGAEWSALGGSYSNGSDGGAACGGSGETYGGGSGGSGSSSPSAGAVRIIWGPDRAFPVTLADDQPTVTYNSTGSTGGTYGGGGVWTGNGGPGFVRIIWGKSRSYPMSNTEDVTFYLNTAGYLTGTKRTISNTGTYKIVGEFDETTINPNSVGSLNVPNLTVPYSSTQDLSSNDFTVEFWLYYTMYSGVFDIFGNFVSGSPGAFKIYIDATQHYVKFIYTDVASGGTTVETNSTLHSLLRLRWHHVAIVRSGSDLNFYINGLLDTQVSITGSIYYYNGITTDLHIGNGGSLNDYFISDLHFVNGTALYTGTTPNVPDTPFVQNDINTVLRIKTYGYRYEDVGPYGIPVVGPYGTSFGGSSNISSFNPWFPHGYYSCLFVTNTNNDYMVVNSTGIVDETGDFTAEFFIKPTAIPGTNSAYIISMSPGQGGSYNITLSTTGKIVITQWTSFTTTATIITSGTGLSINTWYHIALVRSGFSTNNVKLYINGSIDTAVTNITGVTSTVSTADTYIAAPDSVSIPFDMFKGYISNYRFTNGIGIYSGNSFTVPSNPLTKTQNASTNIAAITSVESVAVLTCQSAMFIDNSYYNNATGTANTVPNQIFSISISHAYPDAFSNVGNSRMGKESVTISSGLNYAGSGRTANKFFQTGDLQISGIFNEYDGYISSSTTFTTPGTNTWVCPDEIYEVNVVCVGAGGDGGPFNGVNGYPGAPFQGGSYGSGGGGGGLGWKNSIPVVPGNSYTVYVGGHGGGTTIGTSYFISSSIVSGGGGHNGSSGYSNGGAGGGYTGGGGGTGGAGGHGGQNWLYTYDGFYKYGGGGGGGGAGGYSGTGGAGGNCGMGQYNNNYYPSTYAGATGGAGSGGAGGGGGGGVDGGGVNNLISSETGCGGGGVGLSIAGTSGLGGTGSIYHEPTMATYSYSYPTPGTGGSSGSNADDYGTGGLYGGGGAGSGSGANGAVRIVYTYLNDSSKNFPNNSA